MWERIKRFWGFGKIDTTEAPSGGARDPKKVTIKKVGQIIKDGGSDFEESIVDLDEINRAYHSDSYIKRAVDKYAELMFKTDWEIKSKNEKATEYVWLRLKLIEEATGTPLEEFLMDIAQDLVLYSNAFVVKARQKGSTPSTGVKAVGYTGKQPIAGYFVLPAHTILVSRDPNGKILKYQQKVGGGDIIDIKAEDMIHFYHKKPRGRAFGIPFIFPVLDDVKMLRQIEENIARLIYRNLFPLYQYQVGLEKPGFEASDEEIEQIREQIRDMPMDGGIVVPERHNITVIGAEGKVLDASEYLKYFRQRVFSGLGVSDIIMGIGDSANRSTADNLSADLNDGVKEFQRTFTTIFTSKIINELLFEGGFDPIIKPEDEVDFVFFEIELDAKIKKENHLVQLFTQNAITHEEMRAEMGKDPISDEGRLYFNMVTAALSAQTAQQKTEAANAQGDNKNQPANQHGKQKSPGKPKADIDDEEVILYENANYVLTESSGMVNLLPELRISECIEDLKNLWDLFREDTINMMQSGKSKDQIRAFALELSRQYINSSLEKYVSQALMIGISNTRKKLGVYDQSFNINRESRRLADRYKEYTNRLIGDVSDLIFNALSKEDVIPMITGAFNSNAYRLAAIARTELYRALNYGIALVARHAKANVVSTLSQESCPTCKEQAGKEISLTVEDLLSVIPPHHTNCTCVLSLDTSTEEV